MKQPKTEYLEILKTFLKEEMEIIRNHKKKVIFIVTHKMEYESSGDKNKTLSIEENLNKIRPNLNRHQ